MMFMSSVDEFKSSDSNFEHLLNCMSIRMDNELPDDAPSVPSSIPTVILHVRCTTHLKLAALPKFSGQIVYWHKFWSVKKGEWREKAAQSCSCTKVMKTLKPQFDQPHLILQKWAMKPVNDDNKFR